MNNIESILLKNMRIARKSERITLKEAGERIGVGEATASAIENGKIKLSAVNLYKLCEMYKVKIEDMFDPNYSAYMNEHSEYQEALNRIEKNQKANELQMKSREEIQTSNFVHDRLKKHTIK